jgi:hypothetical protein
MRAISSAANRRSRVQPFAFLPRSLLIEVMTSFDSVIDRHHFITSSPHHIPNSFPPGMNDFRAAVFVT